MPRKGTDERKDRETRRRWNVLVPEHLSRPEREALFGELRELYADRRKGASFLSQALNEGRGVYKP